MRRYALRDDQWNRIKDVLPGREGHVGVTAKDNRLFVEAVRYRYRARHTLAGPAGTFWRSNPGSHAFFALGEARRMEEDLRNAGGRCGQRIRDDRQHHRTRTSAQRRRSKKDGEDQAIGRSKGGLST